MHARKTNRNLRPHDSTETAPFLPSLSLSLVRIGHGILSGIYCPNPTHDSHSPASSREQKPATRQPLHLISPRGHPYVISLSLSLYPSSLRKKGVVNPDSGSSPALCAVGSRVRWPAQSFHRPLTVRSGGPLRPPAAGLDPGPARNGPVKARLGELFDSNSDSPPFCPYPAPPAVRWAGPHPLGGGRPIVRWRGRFGPYGAGRTN